MGLSFFPRERRQTKTAPNAAPKATAIVYGQQMLLARSPTLPDANEDRILRAGCRTFGECNIPWMPRAMGPLGRMLRTKSDDGAPSPAARLVSYVCSPHSIPCATANALFHIYIGPAMDGCSRCALLRKSAQSVFSGREGAICAAARSATVF